MTVTPFLPLAMTMGDPAGCGPQITERAWLSLREDRRYASFVIADPSLYGAEVPTKIITTPEDAFAIWPSALPILPISQPLKDVEVGTASKDHALAVMQSIEQAVSLTKTGEASGIVTNPISKATLYKAGFKHPGHTEYLAELCAENTQSHRPVMMLVGGGLRVALATIHMPLMDVGNALSIDLLTEIAQILDQDLKTRFGIDEPRLVFTGLNPHAGEEGSIGSEEKDVINPAAEILRSEGINIHNARPGDTVFAEALDGHYDAVIAMTHDQGLIPVKTLDLWGGVNCTLGLPIIRTSPDHGTAYDAAANNTARPDSLIAAIKLAAKMAHKL